MTNYRTILAHVGAPFDPGVGRVAVSLARIFDARLVGVTCSGIELMLAPGLVETGSEAVAAHLSSRIRSGLGALDALEDLAHRNGVAQVESLRLNGGTKKELAAQMAFADLVVAAQELKLCKLRNGWRTLPERLLRNAARPVLVVPDGFAGNFLGKRIVIAWDGSAAAARAVFFALPLLKRAAVAEVVTYATDDGFNMPGEVEKLVAYLATHGVLARNTFLRTSHNAGIGKALLGHCQSTSAELLVLGGYGHSRLRELLLGSVSKTVMRHLRLPALFAH